MSSKIACVFSGTIVHSTMESPMVIVEDGVIGIRENGKIAFLCKNAELDRMTSEYDFDPKIIKRLEFGQFIMPGMVDAHIHASQHGYIGTGCDLPLMDWLQTYTFPFEMRFEDLSHAKRYYPKVVRQTLQQGTTTAAYFATIHTDASIVLCDIAEKFGQRAIVGKVNMDTPLHKKYQETSEESLRETKRFLSELEKKNYKLIKPILTPRFALSSTRELMKELGGIARETGVRIQTHISENHEEIQQVKNEFPEYDTYIDIYDAHGLLTAGTLLAHGIYLTDKELEKVKERGSAIVHCPNSNLSIFSGFLDVRKLLDRDVQVCLGTDVAGGYSPSILDAIRRALHVSSSIRINRYGENYRTLTYKEAFRMATLYGARALQLDDEIGNFDVGKSFDALLIDVNASGSQIVFSTENTTEEIVQKFLFCGDDRNITNVFVNGKNLSQTTLVE